MYQIAGGRFQYNSVEHESMDHVVYCGYLNEKLLELFSRFFEKGMHLGGYSALVKICTL